jgi:predicted CoA-binding protein
MKNYKVTASGINEFFQHTPIAVIGISRSGKKFGDAAYRELKKRQHKIVPVHPKMGTFDNDTCYPDFASLPEPAGSVYISTKAGSTAAVVRDAVKSGIRHIWIQPGAQSDEAIAFCREQGVNLVVGECMLMHAQPVTSIHKFHKTLRSIFGLMPK